MKIAVTYQDGMVFQHFGHSQQFKLYGVENGNVIESKIIDTNGQGHGALAGFLSQYHADILIVEVLSLCTVSSFRSWYSDIRWRIRLSR